MLVMRTIKDPPDGASRFTIETHALLYDMCVSIRNMKRVQLTSQVDRGEPEELAVEVHSETEHGSDTHSTSERLSIFDDDWEHTSVEAEGSKWMEAELGSDMECTDGEGTMDIKQVAATTGDNDQEDCNERDDLDIQFVKVITT